MKIKTITTYLFPKNIRVRMSQHHNILNSLYVLLFILVLLLSSCSDSSEDKKTVSDQVTKTDTIKNESEQPEQSINKEESDQKLETTVIPEQTDESVEETDESAEKMDSTQNTQSPEISLKSSQVADIMDMNNPAYSIHEKGIVQFTHKKHIDDHKIGCGECHHDEKGVPLNTLKEGDEVQGCIACHSKAGLAPRQKDQAKLTDTEKRAYHAEAIHDNCVDCHREYNTKNNTKEAPTSCSKCHPKND